MTYVEDLLNGLGILVASGTITDSWSVNFINNVTFHVNSHYSLSTSQSRIILKMAENHLASVASSLRVKRDDIKRAVEYPSYRKPPYQSTNVPREVRYIGTNRLAFRCKRDPVVSADLKNLSVKSTFGWEKVVFNQQYKLWIVPVVDDNLERVMQVIQRHKFKADQDAAEYLTLCHNSKLVKSTLVVDAESNMLYINVCNNPIIAHMLQLMNATPV